MSEQHVLRRIHVVGGEATGKTTISRIIGAQLDVPVVNLDSVAWQVVGEAPFEVWEPGYQPSAPIVKRPLEERRALVHEIAVKPAWVTEGKHLWWTDELFAEADAILFLDHVPARVATFRIVRRAMRSALREMRRQKGLRKFARFRDYARHSGELARQLWHRVGYVRRSQVPAETTDEFSSITRAATLDVLARYPGTVVHCRTGADVSAFLDRLAAQPRPSEEDGLSEAEAPAQAGNAAAVGSELSGSGRIDR